MSNIQLILIALGIVLVRKFFDKKEITFKDSLIIFVVLSVGLIAIQRLILDNI